MHWIIDSKCKNESPLQLSSKKAHKKLTWVLEKTTFSFICSIFSITELDMMYFLKEIFPDNIPEGCGCKCS